jgi:hypothetical protein
LSLPLAGNLDDTHNNDKEGLKMQKLNRIVLYRTITEVKEGDEFYQLSLSKDMRPGAISNVVDRFHGLAGHLPTLPDKAEPEDLKTFPTTEEAVEFFDKSVQMLEERGFVKYDPLIHGQDRAFESD